MKGDVMSEEKRCLKCGSTNVEHGKLQSTGKIYARPDNAKLETVLMTGALVNGIMCFDCGHIEMIAEPDKLKLLTKVS
jgi:predicted nucleic-acid-binding Zn-ribbon protein